MSVIVTIRFPVSDVAKAIKGLHSHAAILDDITQSTLGAGIIHHRFVAGDGEMMVIDEWESAKHFQTFFDANPQIAAVMTAIGMTGPPVVSIFTSIEAPGTI